MTGLVSCKLHNPCGYSLGKHPCDYRSHGNNDVMVPNTGLPFKLGGVPPAYCDLPLSVRQAARERSRVRYEDSTHARKRLDYPVSCENQHVLSDFALPSVFGVNGSLQTPTCFHHIPLHTPTPHTFHPSPKVGFLYIACLPRNLFSRNPVTSSVSSIINHASITTRPEKPCGGC